MGKYFDRFGLVEYNGQIAKNLLTKVDLTQKSKDEVQAKFDYQIDSNIARPDNLSWIVYNSPYYDWLIFLTNTIIDPYYDMFLPDEQLMAKIKKKYSSLENSRKFVLYYRNNWAEDESRISVATYDALDTNIKKYYEPIVNNANAVTEYKRSEIDWIQSTNKIQQLTVDSTRYIPSSGYTSQGSATANIIRVDKTNNIVLINHIEGTFTTGVWGDTNISAVTTLKQNIPDSEAIYWSKVTAYDLETEDNELRRYIALIKNSYVSDLEAQFKEKIK